MPGELSHRAFRFLARLLEQRMERAGKQRHGREAQRASVAGARESVGRRQNPALCLLKVLGFFFSGGSAATNPGAHAPRVLAKASSPSRTFIALPSRPEGILFEDEENRITVWVHTWGQIIESSRGRLEFFKEKLEYSADQDSGLEYLRKTHDKYLPTFTKPTC
jgi:hypothetical protein